MSKFTSLVSAFPVLVGAMVSAVAGPYDTWAKYRIVTVDAAAAGVTSTVTNFPLLVRLTSADAATGSDVLTEALANGADIRFTDATGETPLSYQIDTWTGASAAIWVKVPAVTGSASTSVRLYWGKAGEASASNGRAVFDTANGFAGVWHLGDTTGTNPRPNAITGRHTATPGNFPGGYTPTAGIVGLSDSLGGGVNNTTSRFLKIDSTANASASSYYRFPAGQFSYSVWVNPATNLAFARMISLTSHNDWPAASVGYNRIFFANSNTNGLLAGRQGPGSTSNATNATDNTAGRLALNQWNHVAMTINRGGGQDTIRLFRNGIQLGTQTADPRIFASPSFPDTARGYVYIGKDYINPTSDNTLNGRIDEAQLSHTTRSPAWIRLSYQTQRADSARVTLGATQTVPPPSGPYAAWTYNRSIRLNTGVTGANVAGNVTNFPVLVRLTSAEAAIFTQAKAGGADIRFSKGNDSALPHQIERWNAGANRAEIWVKVDTVKGNDSAQTIKMYWGNSAAADNSSGPGVFGASNGFVAAWHLGDTTASRPNATGGSPAVPRNYTGQFWPGMIGGADSLAGGGNGVIGDSATQHYMTIGADAGYSNFTTGFTSTMWVYSSSVQNNSVILNLSGGTPTATANRLIAGRNAGLGVKFRFNTGTGGNVGVLSPDEEIALGAWQHFTFTKEPSAGSMRVFINGVQDTVVEGVADIPNVARARNFLGRSYATADLYFNGKLDEVRIANVARNAAWAKLEYESQHTHQKFTNIGVTLATAPDAPTGVTGTPGAPNSNLISVSWAAPSNNGGMSITSYTVTSTPGNLTCNAAPPATTCNVTGLTPATGYTFRVTATNAIGTSAPSAASVSVTSPVGVRQGGAFAIRVTGAGEPYLFQLSAEAMAVTEQITMSISDVHGRTVWSRTVNPAAEKVREIAWNGRSSSGAEASAGMYIVRVSMRSGGKTTDLLQKSVTLKSVK